MTLDHLALDRDTRDDLETACERASHFERKGVGSVAEAIRAKAAERAGIDVDALEDALDGPPAGSVADLSTRYDLETLTDRRALEAEIDRIGVIARSAEHRLPKHFKDVSARREALEAILEHVDSPLRPSSPSTFEALANDVGLERGDGCDSLVSRGDR